MIDISAFQLLLTLLTGWLDRQEREVLRYLLEENRVLRRQLSGRRLRLTDADRRRLAVRAYRLGRGRLREIVTVVTPDTLLRWHRQLIARKWTYGRRCQSRRGVLTEIRRLTVQMAEENPTWGYTRIQGALRNVGHRVGRSTVARILKAAGVPPQPQRPTSWQTFLRAHWGVIAGADFFTTEVWTWRGLVTYYTVFVNDLASRRAHILGSTPHPHELFMRQVGRTLTTADDGILRAHRVLICDRDAKWSGEVRRLLGDGGFRVVQTPWRAPNANAHAERFVRSIKQECLDRLILLGERHFRQTVSEYVAHYHHERNHQGLGNTLIDGIVSNRRRGRIRRRPRTRWPPELLRAGRVMRASVNLSRLGGAMGHYGVLICDRDHKWSGDVRQMLEDAGVHVVQMPFQAPNANAYAERFIRSIKQECLDRIIPLGERHFRQTVSEYVAHYRHERNHQGLGNRLIDEIVPTRRQGRIRRRSGLGGLLNYYERAA